MVFSSPRSAITSSKDDKERSLFAGKKGGVAELVDSKRFALLRSIPRKLSNTCTRDV